MKSQADTDKNFGIVNDHIATLTTNLSTPDGMKDILSIFLNNFTKSNYPEWTLHQEGVESSHSMGIHSNIIVCDLYLPKVDVNKFDGSLPRSIKGNIIFHFMASTTSSMT
jgi:hypothetical protein